MPLYEAHAEDPIGAVVVIQEAFGVNEHIQDVTRRFAGEGYHAVAPHLFHRTGDPVIPYTEFSQVVEHIQALTDGAIMTDVDATLSYLRTAGWGNASTGIVGFCMGGRATFLTSARRALGAAVGFYGGGIVSSRRPGVAPIVEEASSLKTPWLGLFGDQDPSIPIEEVELLRVALAAAQVKNEIVRFSDAGHGFFCDRRDSYNADAAEDAWQRTLHWLRAHLAR
jgi:carboxymethylenebutenolidase